MGRVNRGWKGLKKSTKTDFATYLGVIAAFVLVNALRGGGMLSSSLTGQLVPICCYIVMALSLNLTVGVLGELSLGHAGFMSVGAFSGIIAAMSLQRAIPFAPVRLAVAMAVGAVFAALAGVVVGVPVLRLRGDYLAIVTLAFGQIMGLKEGGIAIIKGAQGATGTVTIASFAAGFVLIMIALAVILNLVHSRSGRAIMALRDNQIAAESVGINVTKYKMMAFVTSAALAGAAGALYGLNYGNLLASKFDFNTSILVLVFVVLGGLGNMWGSIIAATVLYILPELLREVRDYRMLVYAIVLILVMLATNNAAIKGFFARIFRREKGGAVQ